MAVRRTSGPYREGKEQHNGNSPAGQEEVFSLTKNRKKNTPRPVSEEAYIKDFLDMIAPSVIDFKVDHYLCGNTCRCVWALREYPTSTDEQAILRHLGEMDGVTIRIYTRQVTPSEERRIIHNAANKHRMSRSSTEDLQQTVTAEANLQDVVPWFPPCTATGSRSCTARCFWN